MYITIQDFMLDLGLKGNELIVYAVIYGFSQDGKSRFCGSLSYLSKWTNATERSVINALQSLREKHLIDREETTVKGIKTYNYFVIRENISGGSEKFSPHNIVYNNIIEKRNIKEKREFSEKNREFSEKNREFSEEFDELWSVYPKQRAGSKDKAYKAFLAAVKRGTSPQRIITTAKQYAASLEVARGYAKGCAAWLNDDRFLQEYKTDDFTIEW